MRELNRLIKGKDMDGTRTCSVEGCKTELRPHNKTGICGVCQTKGHGRAKNIGPPVVKPRKAQRISVPVKRRPGVRLLDRPIPSGPESMTTPELLELRAGVEAELRRRLGAAESELAELRRAVGSPAPLAVVPEASGQADTEARAQP